MLYSPEIETLDAWDNNSSWKKDEMLKLVNAIRWWLLEQKAGIVVMECYQAAEPDNISMKTHN